MGEPSRTDLHWSSSHSYSSEIVLSEGNNLTRDMRVSTRDCESLVRHAEVGKYQEHLHAASSLAYTGKALASMDDDKQRAAEYCALER